MGKLRLQCALPASIRQVVIWVASFWTLMIAAVIYVEFSREKSECIEYATLRAKEAYSKDLAYRKWVASHGGVYVPVDSATPPNPYLSAIPERDITTPSGKRLTLMNPAYVTRQVLEGSTDAFSSRGHITSLRPIRPENAPDPWERTALERFERGEREVIEVTSINHEPALRYMRAMMVEWACLKCHSNQGYKLGDVRGGISASVLLKPYLIEAVATWRHLATMLGIVWLAGLLGLLLGARTVAGRMEEGKLASQRVSESEQQLKRAQHFARIGSWTWDIQADKLEWSDEMYRIFGLSRDGFNGSVKDVVARAIHPDDRDAVERSNLAVVNENRPTPLEYRIVWQDGSVHHVWAEAGELLLDEDGRPARLSGIVQDITERKLADAHREKLEEHLRQAHKMEAIGTLAGGIAHDFNNLLFSILGHAEMLQDALRPGSQEMDDVKALIRSGERAKALVQRILTFSRRREMHREPLRLLPIVEEMAAMLQATLAKTLNVRIEVEGVSECCVVADETELQQIVLNIGTNAAQAMEGGSGELVFRVTMVRSEDIQARFPVALAPGDYVMLQVADSGVGMSPEVQARIYEPFFTTKATGKGTGMGMSTVHGIVHSLGGEIAVQSELGKGTTVSVIIPATSAMPSKASAKNSYAAPASGQLLVVDDDVDILEVLSHTLASLGYSVTTCSSPAAALDQIANGLPEIDLLLTDYRMPDMTGLELAKSARALRPELAVVICTGYADEIDFEEVVPMGVAAVLYKPVPKHELAETLLKHLEHRPVISSS